MGKEKKPDHTKKLPNAYAKGKQKKGEIKRGKDGKLHRERKYRGHKNSKTKAMMD